MIVSTLVRRYDRLVSRRAAPEFGYSREKVSYAIILSAPGEAVDVQSLLDTSGKQPRPRILEVPRYLQMRTSGVRPYFLWDKTDYVLGIQREKPDGSSVQSKRHFEAFRELHRSLIKDSADPGLQALRAFLNSWDPDQYDEFPHAEEMLGANVVFRLDGHPEFVHQTDEARKVWTAHLNASAEGTGICMVSGNDGPLTRLHLPIKGVDGAQSSGASLVSFNQDAFCSYGKSAGDKSDIHAPFSQRAAFGYVTALNLLLRRRDRGGRNVRIGDTNVVHWAEGAGEGTEADAAENLMDLLIDPSPSLSDEEETAKLDARMRAIAAGRPLAEIDPHLRDDTRYYLLGLAPNAARLSVRFWHADTMGNLARRIGEHHRDLSIEPVAWSRPPPVSSLLIETQLDRSREKLDWNGARERVSPVLGGMLMRSVFVGGSYPHPLLAGILARIRADGAVTGLRAAICKAFLAREHRLGRIEEDVPMSLDPNHDHPAYLLGRAFSLYDRLQFAALGETNATLKDRYYGSASATPVVVFPLLARGSIHHLGSLRKKGSGGLAHWYEQEIAGVLTKLGPEFPRVLSLEEQGRFALGYYHQTHRTKKAEPSGGEENGEANETVASGQEEPQ